mmetsp:Transcript_47247/g.136090  ORF Transcript_47247/g.136090 Transcript_47247/m.136090 type:complete len:208 (-) Transcript_47247:45-668(-)
MPLQGQLGPLLRERSDVAVPQAAEEPRSVQQEAVARFGQRHCQFRGELEPAVRALHRLPPLQTAVLGPCVDALLRHGHAGDGGAMGLADHTVLSHLLLVYPVHDGADEAGAVVVSAAFAAFASASAWRRNEPASLATSSALQHVVRLHQAVAVVMLVVASSASSAAATAAAASPSGAAQTVPHGVVRPRAVAAPPATAPSAAASRHG